MIFRTLADVLHVAERALGSPPAFLGVNGRRLALDNDEAYDLVIDIATGQLDDVSRIAVRLRLR